MNSSKLFICLFHGRHSRDQPMDDWGFTGPIIGPVGVTWSYDTIKLHHPDHGDFEELPQVGSLVAYAGKYYGDFVILIEGDPFLSAPHNANRPRHDWNKFVETRRRTT